MAVTAPPPSLDTMSVCMEQALIHAEATNIHTARALLRRHMISHFRSLHTEHARYVLTLTELGLGWQRWLKRLMRTA